MSPEQALEWSVAAAFGAIALMMLAYGRAEAGRRLVSCLPAHVVRAVMVIVSLWWEKQEREWEREKAADRESGNGRSAAQWKSEAECWKARAINAEGAAGLWKATVGAVKGASCGRAGSLSALAKACGSKRSLVSLLHPDRHRNSRAANSATAHVMKHLPK